MPTIYIYHATTCQYLGQRSFQEKETPYIEEGQGCTATPGPEGETLSEHYIWDGNVWRKPLNQ